VVFGCLCARACSGGEERGAGGCGVCAARARRQ
jgi:hypothetical protein